MQTTSFEGKWFLFCLSLQTNVNCLDTLGKWWEKRNWWIFSLFKRYWPVELAIVFLCWYNVKVALPWAVQVGLEVSSQTIWCWVLWSWLLLILPVPCRKNSYFSHSFLFASCTPSWCWVLVCCWFGFLSFCWIFFFSKLKLSNVLGITFFVPQKIESNRGGKGVLEWHF